MFSHSQSEREEFETEYKQKYEREKILLTEENKKLSTELDKVRYPFVCRIHIPEKQTSPSQLFYSITSLFNNPADWVLVQRQLLHAHAEIRIP